MRVSFIGKFLFVAENKRKATNGRETKSSRGIFPFFRFILFYFFFFSKKRAGNIQKNSRNIYLRGSKYFECINDWNDRDKVNVCAARVIYIAEKKKNIIPIVRYLPREK